MPPARRDERESSNGHALAADALSGNVILANLRLTSRQRFEQSAVFQIVEKSEPIFRQDALATRFWLLVRGEVKLLKYTTRGAALLIDIIMPNHLLGAVFYEPNPVYPYTAQAIKRTALLSFPLQDLLDELEANPALQKALLRDTCQKLAHANQMRGLSLEHARVRVAHQLLLLSEKFGPVIPQTRAVLAELAGTTVETAIRISTAMARDGIILTRRGEIEVLCQASLRAYAKAPESVGTCAGL